MVMVLSQGGLVTLLCALLLHGAFESCSGASESLIARNAAAQQRRAQLRSEALAEVGDRGSMVNARSSVALSTGVGLGDLLNELDGNDADNSDDAKDAKDGDDAAEAKGDQDAGGAGATSSAQGGEEQVVDLGEALAARVLVERHRIQKENRELHGKLSTAQSEGDAKIDKLSHDLQAKQKQIAELQQALIAANVSSQQAPAEPPAPEKPAPPAVKVDKSASLLSVAEGAKEKELQAEVDQLKGKLALVDQASDQDGVQKMRTAFMTRIKQLESTRKRMVDALSEDRAKAAAETAKAKAAAKDVQHLKNGLSKGVSAIRKAQKRVDAEAPKVSELQDKLNRTIQVRLGEEASFNDEKQQITNAALAKTKYLEEERDDLHHEIRKSLANATSLAKHMADFKSKTKVLQGDLAKLKKVRDQEQAKIVTQNADVLKLRKQIKKVNESTKREAAEHEKDTLRIKAAALDKVHELEDERESLSEDLGSVRGNASQALGHFKKDMAKLKQTSQQKQSDQKLVLKQESAQAANATAAEQLVFKNQTFLQKELADEWLMEKKDKKQEAEQGATLKAHTVQLVSTKKLLKDSQAAAVKAQSARKASDLSLAQAKSSALKASLAREKGWSTKFLAAKSQALKADAEAKHRLEEKTKDVDSTRKSTSTMQAEITKLGKQTATDKKNLEAKKAKWETDRVALKKKTVDETAQSEKDLMELKKREASDKTRLDGELKAYEKREADSKAQRDADEANDRKVKASVDAKEHDLQALKNDDSTMSKNLTTWDSRSQDYSAQMQKLQTESDALRSANVQDTTARAREESIVSALKSQVEQAKQTEATAAENMRQAAKVGTERDQYRSQLTAAMKETSTWMQAEETAHTEAQQSEKEAHAVSEQLEDVKGEDERHTTLLTKLLAYSKTEQDKMKMGVSLLTSGQKQKLSALSAASSTSMQS